MRLKAVATMIASSARRAYEPLELGYCQKQEEASTGDLGHFLSVQTDDYCGYKHTSFGLTKYRAECFEDGVELLAAAESLELVSSPNAA
jgi:hypothetical protein